MSDPDNFLARWSRRKREAGQESTNESTNEPAKESAKEGGVQESPAGAGPIDQAQSTIDEAAEPAFDLSKLPSIESITADTDISGFLAPGVPAELKTAALRRAWAADPRIRDFVGLNDYDFDFHTPGAIPGFGALEMTDALRREVARLVGGVIAPPELPAAAPAQPFQPIPQAAAGAQKTGNEESTAVVPSRASEQDQLAYAKDFVALQQKIPSPENLQKPAKRSHGKALPK